VGAPAFTTTGAAKLSGLMVLPANGLATPVGTVSPFTKRKNEVSPFSVIWACT
jgi:hypothetical protein